MPTTADLLTTGWQLHQSGDLARAEQAYRQFLRREPRNAQGWYLLGALRHTQGNFPDAISHFRRALETNPGFAEAHLGLGHVSLAQGRLDDASAAYRTAVQLNPGLAEPHLSLGNALQAQGRLDEALAAFRAAARLKPGLAEAHLGLGNVLQLQGHLDEALTAYRTALHFQPGSVEVLHGLGNVFQAQGRIDDALAAYRTALLLQPRAAVIHSNLVFLLQYHAGYDAQAILAETRRWYEQHALPLQSAIRPHTNEPDPDRRLRVGYVSPDFRKHAITFFTSSLLANHNHGLFEIFCYSNVRQPDALTERLRGHADVWRDTRNQSDEQLTELIRRDQIDILVDLTMHMSDNRLLVFARKPAPVQITWVAYPGTTGLSTIDYRLTDPYLDPPGYFDADYAEESLRLGDTFWCYDPFTEQPAVNALPAAQNDHVTFGCLNYFAKLNDGVLALWAKVLHAVPQSRLLLLAPRGQARSGVLTRLQQEGVAAERVEFADMQPRQDYLRLFHRIDVGLDPFPYNGHTTSLDAFWMGVPAITLVGQTVVGRAGWSQLCNLGLQELAAQSPEQYVALVTQLAGDLPRLQELRSTLRERMRRSPLMDGPRFARHVEQAYRQVWRRWCEARRAVPCG